MMNLAKKRKPKAPKKKSKKASGSKLGVVNVKMSAADRKHLKAKAKRFADGNLSAWLRYAGGKYTPKKGEKVSLETT